MVMAHAATSRADPGNSIWTSDVSARRCLSRLAATVLLVLTGCMPPVMQPWAGLNYGVGVGRVPPVYADALLPFGGGIADGVMVDVSIWLDNAPTFTVVFPDGFGVASRAITTEVLRDHGRYLGAPSRINAKRVDYQEWESSNGVTVIFEITADRATVLRFCSPTRLLDSGARTISFIAADGTAVTLPVTYAGMTHMFGPHSHATQDFLLAKFSC